MNLARSKALQAGLVILIAIAIILAGAFAWYSFTQQALNIFEGFTNPGVNIHDIHKDSDSNKDVFVENSGERPLYLRVKFNEYMQIDGSDMVLGSTAEKDDLSTWHVHKEAGTAEYCNLGYHDHYTWIMGGRESITGDKENGQKYYLPAPFSKRALFDKDGRQLSEPQVVMNYDESRVVDPIYGTDYDSSMTDPDTYLNSRESNVDADARIRTKLAEEISLGHTYLDELLVLQKAVTDALGDAAKLTAQNTLNAFMENNLLGYYDLVYEVNPYIEFFDADDSVNISFNSANKQDVNDSTVYDAVNGSGGPHLIHPTYVFVPMKQTLSIRDYQDTLIEADSPVSDKDARVYTMDQWILDGMPNGNFWVIDTDGWCYWADVLLPGQATGLLLSEILLNEDNKPQGVWYYGVNVELQAVTYDDLKRFASVDLANPDSSGGGITDNGMRILDGASGMYVFDQDAGATGINETVYTFYDHKNGVFSQVMVDNQGKESFGANFIYTGDLPADIGTFYDLTKSYDAGANPNKITDEYQVDTTFTKYLSAKRGHAVFTVVPIDGATPASDIYQNSPVYEGKNGRHYVKLKYDLEGEGAGTGGGTAWLAVGPNGRFDTLEDRDSADASTTGIALGTSAGQSNKKSDNDDILVWTDEDLPGTAADRTQEEPVVSTVKVGDTLNIDGIDWLVVNIGGSTDSDDVTLITKDVVNAETAKNYTEAAAYLTTFDVTLTNLNAVTTDAVVPKLLTVREANTFFVNNASRVVASGEQWWLLLDGGTYTAIDKNGSFLPVDSGDATGDFKIQVRPAVTLANDKLEAALIAEANS